MAETLYIGAEASPEATGVQLASAQTPRSGAAFKRLYLGTSVVNAQEYVLLRDPGRWS